MKKLYVLISFLFFVATAGAQLTGIIPDSAQVGQTLTTTITSSGIFQINGTPSGNISEIRFQNGPNLFYAYNWATTLVIDPDTLTTQVPVPANAAPGIYDLIVTDMNFVDYTLPAAFTVLPADGYAQGNVYFDTNGNGTRDLGENGISNMSIIYGTGLSVITNANGDFSIPLIAGSHTIRCMISSSHAYVLTTDSIQYTITITSGNVTGLDFGLKDGLYGLTPSSGYNSQSNINAIVFSDSLFQQGANPWGNISSVVFSISNYSFSTPISRVTVLSPTQAQILFDIPSAQAQLVYDLRITISGSPNLTYLQPQAFTVTQPPSYISGQLYLDVNQNGVKDSGENPVVNERVFLEPDSAYGFSGSNGIFSIGAALGAHYLSFSSANGLYTVSSAPTHSFTNTGDTTGLDFGLKFNTAPYTSDINLMLALLRCNQLVTHTIKYTNHSNVVSQGVIWMLLSSNVSFSSANPAISSQSGDTLFWNFSNLQPGEQRTITFTVGMPGMGPTVSFYANMIVTDGSGNVMYTTADDGGGTVACSFDPNDKACDPPGVDDIMHYTLFSDTLEYLIRFQNSGTDTAFNIFILDTIDAALDLSTFELLDVSHSMLLTIDSNRAAVFRFDNILLPDSNVDESGSHGYILYRIRPKAGLPDPTRIENTAYIYFDLNPPILTNTTWNTLVTMIPVSVGIVQANENGVIFYPNPMTNSGTFYFENDNQDLIHFELMDINGRVVISGTSNSEEIKINRDGLSSGMYLYKLLNSSSGNSMNGKIIIE